MHIRELKHTHTRTNHTLTMYPRINSTWTNTFINSQVWPPPWLMTTTTSAYPVFIKTIIFSLVLISVTCSIINLVQGVKKYLREFSQTKRAFFALNFNIILIGVLGSLTFGCVYTIAAFFIDKFEAKTIFGTESVLESGYGMNTSEFFENERRKQQIMTEDSESLKMRILMPICLSFQLAAGSSKVPVPLTVPNPVPVPFQCQCRVSGMFWHWNVTGLSENQGFYWFARKFWL